MHIIRRFKKEKKFYQFFKKWIFLKKKNKKTIESIFSIFMASLTKGNAQEQGGQLLGCCYGPLLNYYSKFRFDQNLFGYTTEWFERKFAFSKSRFAFSEWVFHTGNANLLFENANFLQSHSVFCVYERNSPLPPHAR